MSCFLCKSGYRIYGFFENEVKMKTWVSRDKVLEMLKDNETKDGFSILALLVAFEFYK